MYELIDQNGCRVRLTFDEAGFTNDVKHVWVICRYQNQWLLTNHSKRGLEFPGGKVEHGEALKEAAKREVMEETGGVVDSLHYVGQYEVTCEKDVMYKTIYFATISHMMEQDHFFETEGPVLFDELPEDLVKHDEFSFIMKDQVLSYSLEQINKRNLL